MYASINTFLFGGCFGVFYAKNTIFMARVLVLNIKLSCHNISGLKIKPHFGSIGGYLDQAYSSWSSKIWEQFHYILEFSRLYPKRIFRKYQENVF